MRGEKWATVKRPSPTPGSPPRARGKDQVTTRRLRPPRITPACAGKRSALFGILPGGGDHPRVRGEKGENQQPARTNMGSPPRARGKGCISIFFRESMRITPACAGKSLSTALCAMKTRDHPRVRGEKSAKRLVCRSLAGSPPRVRGKVDRVAQHHVQNRITPACAGKSLPVGAVIGIFGDHPRVCGEKRARGCTKVDKKGSPPRARGKACRPHCAQ